ncbi:MAG: nuclease [Clostridiales bacterium]|nr:nuclease [Clostridiales bacterium]
MNITEEIDQKHQEDLARLRAFRLFDDDFMVACLQRNPACTQLVLRILLDQPDLEVSDVRTQVFVENLLNRSVRLDILATDDTGKKYNIEIQREDRGAGRKRARYNSSMMDANLLKKGEDFEQLPETYVIFITEKDVMGEGQALYEIERYIKGSGKPFLDGTHILYVNGRYQDETPVGRLMHDFNCTNASDMHYKVLAEEVRFFKEQKEGILIMCKAMEDMRNQALQEGLEAGRKEGIKEGIQKGRKEGIQEGIKEGIQTGKKEGRKEIALRMLELGKYTFDEISSLSELSLEEVKTLQAENNR